MSTTTLGSWSEMSYHEKQIQLYLRQKELLCLFLQNGAITKAEYEKTLHDLMEKMQH